MRVVRQICIAALMAITAASYAADLVVGKPASNDDGGISVAIDLLPGVGDAVGALQFDVMYDADRYSLDAVRAGAASEAAGKSVSFNEYSAGKVRVILAGLNRNAIVAGPVAVFSLRGSGVEVGGAVSVERVILSDPFGQEVSVRVVEHDGSGKRIPLTTVTDAGSSNGVAAWTTALVLFALLALATRYFVFAPQRRRQT